MKIFLFLLVLLCLKPSAGALSVNELNRAFRTAFFSEKKQWDFADFRKRTRLYFNGNHNRFNARHIPPIAGAKVEELIVYTRNNNRDIVRITIIFANKGDTPGHYNRKIKNADQNLSAMLTGLCGVKRRGNFVSGSIRKRVDRWQTPFADICLEIKRKEFVMLHIIPKENQRTAATRPAAEDYKKNVRRNKFGDVYIANIPMVDQGNKGYCAPASIARIFLYFGSDMDMHQLADLSKTSRDKGTALQPMLRLIASERRKNGLLQQNVPALNLKHISKYIDRGFPILWSMFYTDRLNNLCRFSQTHRHRASSPREWAKKIRKSKLDKKREAPHLCLIIGYNPITDEIAISNSWGDAHTVPRWIPAKEAKKVSQGSMLVFHP